MESVHACSFAASDVDDDDDDDVMLICRTQLCPCCNSLLIALAEVRKRKRKTKQNDMLGQKRKHKNPVICF